MEQISTTAKCYVQHIIGQKEIGNKKGDRYLSFFMRDYCGYNCKIAIIPLYLQLSERQPEVHVIAKASEKITGIVELFSKGLQRKFA